MTVCMCVCECMYTVLRLNFQHVFTVSFESSVHVALRCLISSPLLTKQSHIGCLAFPQTLSVHLSGYVTPETKMQTSSHFQNRLFQSFMYRNWSVKSVNNSSYWTKKSLSSSVGFVAVWTTDDSFYINYINFMTLFYVHISERIIVLITRK